MTLRDASCAAGRRYHPGDAARYPRDKTPTRVLVICQSTQASGAPIALLRIVNQCVAHGMLEPIFVVRDRGDLLASLEVLGPTVRISARTERHIARAATSLPFGGKALALTESVTKYRLRQICRRCNVQAIYVNSATQAAFVAHLQPLRLPIITHVHELERALRASFGITGIKAVIEQSDMLIAVSPAVRTMLLAHGAESTRIVDVPEPIAEDTPLCADDRIAMRRAVFGVDDDAVLVLACGLPSWRKGTDAFLHVAKDVLGRTPTGTKVAFRWLGGTLPNAAMTILIDDIACLGLEGHVTVIPHMQNAERLLAAADILISTSREDPNPLVVLEAAAAGCPVVCFRDAGGAEELADAGGGKAVPYLDAKAMADAILALIESPEERELLGDTARMIVKEHNAPHVVAEEMATVLRRCAVSHNDTDYD